MCWYGCINYYYDIKTKQIEDIHKVKFWFLFNGGSSLGIANGASVFMSRAIMNTFIAGASGALTVFFIYYIMNID